MRWCAYKYSDACSILISLLIKKRKMTDLFVLLNWNVTFVENPLELLLQLFHKEPTVHNSLVCFLQFAFQDNGHSVALKSQFKTWTYDVVSKSAHMNNNISHIMNISEMFKCSGDHSCLSHLIATALALCCMKMHIKQKSHSFLCDCGLV